MRTVLLVEDDDDTREFMHIFLETYLGRGLHVITARNGREALAQLATTPVRLILLDLHMPVMDGFEFRRRQLANPALAGIPTICLTAFFDRTLAEHVLGVPCFGKPLDDSVVDVILDIVG